MANRKYTDDQRAEAIRLVTGEGHSAASVAREFSVSVGTVHRWVSDAQALRSSPLPVSAAAEHAPLPDDQPDLETELRSVIVRIGRLETQMELLSQLPHPRDDRNRDN